MSYLRLSKLVRRLLFEGGIVVETPFEPGASSRPAVSSLIQTDGDIIVWIDPEAVGRRDLQGAHLDAVRSELAILTALPGLVRWLPWAGVLAGLLIGAAEADLPALSVDDVGALVDSIAAPLLWPLGGLSLGWLLPLITKAAFRLWPAGIPKDLEGLVSSEESLREDARRCAGRAQPQGTA